MLGHFEISLCQFQSALSQIVLLNMARTHCIFYAKQLRITVVTTTLVMSQYDKASLNVFVHDNGNYMLIPKGSLRDKNIALFAETLCATPLGLINLIFDYDEYIKSSFIKA